MSEILDSIVHCTISIEAPVMDSESFGTILLVGHPPVIKGEDIEDVGVYTSLKTIVNKGWDETTRMYQAAKAAFLQSVKSIYIAVWKEDEEIGTTVNRALDKPGWYGIATVDADKSEYEKVAELIETREKIFCFATDELGSPLTKTEYFRTLGIYSDKDEFINVAWMAKCFGYDAGSESWEYKTLAGVEASEYRTSNIQKLDAVNISYYTSCSGKNITRGGKMIGGEWIDVIRFRDWLKNQMQISIFRLFTAYAKLPYTDDGIILIENMMESVLKSGQRVGGIDETRYDTEGRPEYGYVVSVPKASSLNNSQRASRQLPNCDFTARLSGAISVIEIQGNLVY